MTDEWAGGQAEESGGRQTFRCVIKLKWGGEDGEGYR